MTKSEVNYLLDEYRDALDRKEYYLTLYEDDGESADRECNKVEYFKETARARTLQKIFTRFNIEYRTGMDCIG